MTHHSLEQIRHNWQEKGNGPRGRDVDFLLGLVDGNGDDREDEQRELRKDAEKLYRRYRDSLTLPYPQTNQVLIAALALNALAALPATESAQPEEERNG